MKSREKSPVCVSFPRPSNDPASAQIANQQFEEVRFYRTLARALTVNLVPDFTSCNARIAVDFLHDSKNAS